MEVAIANIGPVRAASVRLEPLTVFVGPNNSGKSVVMTVLYSALTQFGTFVPFEVTRILRRRASELGDSDIEVSAALAELLASASKRPEIDRVPATARDVLQNQIVQAFDIYARVFGEQLSRSTGTRLTDLRRVHKGTSRSSIVFSSDRPNWRLAMRLTASGPRFETAPPSLDEVWAEISPEAWRRIRFRSRRVGMPDTISSGNLSLELIRACFAGLPRHTKYMPAARSGLMQSHKALAGSLVRRASYAGIQDMQIPAVTGIIADFLGEMIEVEPRPSGQFAERAGDLERTILNGEIDLRVDDSGYTEPVYRSLDGEFPLGRTSSMVSELAPVVLYLRSILQRGDLLMIEEPEAHLHPQAQVAFAKVIVKLVNSGLMIAMTTHSEFFLQQLNNAVLASAVDPDASDQLGLGPDTRLSPGNASAYLFCPSATDGTYVRELEIDTRDGIPESSFSDVAEYLYAQTVALDKRVNGDVDS